MKETAILAGGCFWGMQDLFRKLTGVMDTEVGYAGGDGSRATYEHVKTGTTGHAEAIKLIFDSSKVSYEDILLFFFKIHDPTEPNKQGNDIGTQYRSEIFYLNEEQKEIALKVIDKVNKSNQWGRPLATNLSAAEVFYPAEHYHQDYLEKNPRGYTCHFIRNFNF